MTNDSLMKLTTANPGILNSTDVVGETRVEASKSTNSDWRVEKWVPREVSSGHRRRSKSLAGRGRIKRTSLQI
jgi:hypothetical protein